MSNVSGKAEHLIRAALKGIEKEPETWDQGSWINSDSGRPCGTTYCLGGWMMLYDGWTYYEDLSAVNSSEKHIWTKGGTSVDPYYGFLRDLVYGESGYPDFHDSIFSTVLSTIEALVDRIEDQMEINFEEDCPCLTEQDLCILQGCPCGVHTAALETAPSTPVEIHNPMMKVIETLVDRCTKAGDPITVEQVLEDEPLMEAFRAMFMAGETSLITTVTRKADRRIGEVRVQLQAMTTSRDEVIRRNSELQREVANLQQELGEAGVGDREYVDPWERDKVIRGLQRQVDELRDGSRRTPEYRKMKAAVNRLEQENAALRLTGASLVKQAQAARDELMKQKRVVAAFGTTGPVAGARKEGFRKAVDAWQKALDIVKSQENL